MLLNKKNIIILVFTFIFCSLLICCQFYLLSLNFSIASILITLLTSLGLVLYFLTSIYTVFTISKLETVSTDLEKLLKHNQTLELLQDKLRAFKHDFPNILQGIEGYISTNDMDGLKVYYSQLVNDVSNVNSLSALNPKVINNPAIYNILANKYYKADNLGIKINLEIFLDLNQLNMKIYEFTRILGILMDNAIEAASESENKIINVTIRKDSHKNMQLLLVENTYKDKNIDTNKIFEKGYSTKTNNTGLGLWEIRQILKKNNNLNLYTNKNDNFFIQQFEIYMS